MKLTITRSNLLAALSRCLPIAKQRTTMPVLSCVLIRAELLQPVTVQASNLQQSVTSRTPADVAVAGSTCVSARDLEQRVKTFPEGPITVTLDGPHLQLVAGKRKHRIPVVDPVEFPPLAPAPEAGVSLPGVALATVLEQVKPAASEDVDRINLHAIFLEFLPNELRATATDGRRIYEATQPAPGLAARPPVLLPIDSVDAILSSLDKSVPAHIGMSGLELGVRSGDTIFTTKLVQAEFPQLADFWTRMPSDALTVDPAELADALSSVSLGSKDGDLSGLVNWDLEAGELALSAEGKGAASGSVQVDGNATMVGFTAATPLLLPLLRVSPSPLHLHPPVSPLDPLYLTSPGLRGIVMPCRR